MRITLKYKVLKIFSAAICAALLGASLSGCLVPRGRAWDRTEEDPVTEASSDEETTGEAETPGALSAKRTEEATGEPSAERTEEATGEPVTEYTEKTSSEEPTDSAEPSVSEDPTDTESTLEASARAFVPVTKTEIGLNNTWEFSDFSVIHDGTAVLYRTPDSNGIVIGVNAGHGTRGGESKKTYCHPDMSPKVTGGTTAKGSIQGVAVSSGMTFNDGTAERDVTYAMACILRDRLLEEGFDVLMLRDGQDVQLDNIGRTVISNNLADCHIALHWDGDSKDYDKGAYYLSVPDGIKYLPTVASHWEESERLGDALIRGLRSQGARILGQGAVDQDLSQIAFSRIPTVVIELGNQCSDHSEQWLEVLGEGLVRGIREYYDER